MTRGAVLGCLGAAVGLAATVLLNLNVHLGLHDLAGAPRLIVATLGGAIGGVLLDYVLREHFVR